jgi:hypothetical protein
VSTVLLRVSESVVPVFKIWNTLRQSCIRWSTPVISTPPGRATEMNHDDVITSSAILKLKSTRITSSIMFPERSIQRNRNGRTSLLLWRMVVRTLHSRIGTTTAISTPSTIIQHWSVSAWYLSWPIAHYADRVLRYARPTLRCRSARGVNDPAK